MAKLPPPPADVIDPNTIGPLGCCLSCLTPYSGEVTYCLNCGHIAGFQAVTDEPKSEACFVHSDTRATRYCVLCERPICNACLQREGVSLVSGLLTPQCNTCVTAIANL